MPYYQQCLDDICRAKDNMDFRPMCVITASVARECYIYGAGIQWSEYGDLRIQCG